MDIDPGESAEWQDALAALTAPREQGRVDAQTCGVAIARYDLAAGAAALWAG